MDPHFRPFNAFGPPSMSDLAWYRQLTGKTPVSRSLARIGELVDPPTISQEWDSPVAIWNGARFNLNPVVQPHL
jgi:hypothetical protein